MALNQSAAGTHRACSLRLSTTLLSIGPSSFLLALDKSKCNVYTIFILLSFISDSICLMLKLLNVHMKIYFKFAFPVSTFKSENANQHLNLYLQSNSFGKVNHWIPLETNHKLRPGFALISTQEEV